jgi:hypothetical protein
LPNEKPKLNVFGPAPKLVAKNITILSVLSLSINTQLEVQDIMVKPSVKQRNSTFPNLGVEPCLTQS